jgi:hypothetical protein
VPDRRDFCALDEEAKAGGGVAGMDGGAVLADEHVAGVVPDLPGGGAAAALLELPSAVLAQHLHPVFVHGDGAGAGGGLRFAFDDLVAGGGAVAFDEQPVVEVDLGPAQPAGLAERRCTCWAVRHPTRRCRSLVGKVAVRS